MKKYRILVIDDDVAIRDTLEDWLELNGHHVVKFATADEERWLSQWQWENFDCIITGINQPGMKGLEFTKMVHFSGGPPVIIMSGMHDAEIRAFESGCAAFLKKPVNLQKLIEVIDFCCQN